MYINLNLGGSIWLLSKKILGASWEKHFFNFVSQRKTQGFLSVPGMFPWCSHINQTLILPNRTKLGLVKTLSRPKTDHTTKDLQGNCCSTKVKAILNLYFQTGYGTSPFKSQELQLLSMPLQVLNNLHSITAVSAPTTHNCLD